MKLSNHIRQQEQKTTLDSIYDLRNVAQSRGISAYVLHGRLLVWCNGGYEEIATQQQLDEVCK